MFALLGRCPVTCLLTRQELALNLFAFSPMLRNPSVRTVPNGHHDLLILEACTGSMTRDQNKRADSKSGKSLAANARQLQFPSDEYSETYVPLHTIISSNHRMTQRRLHLPDFTAVTSQHSSQRQRPKMGTSLQISTRTVNIFNLPSPPASTPGKDSVFLYRSHM